MQICKIYRSWQKTLKKNFFVIIESHQRTVTKYASKKIGLRRKNIVFLDKCKLNLHVSNNYSSFAINQTTIAIVNLSKEKNMSLCCVLFF